MISELFKFWNHDIEIDVLHDDVSPKIYAIPKSNGDHTKPEGSVFIVKLSVKNHSERMIEFNRSRLEINNQYLAVETNKFYDKRQIDTTDGQVIFQDCKSYETLPRIYHSGPISPSGNLDIMVPHLSFSIVPERHVISEIVGSLYLISDSLDFSVKVELSFENSISIFSD